MRRHVVVVLVVGVAGLLAAACGGGDAAEEPAPTTGPTTSADATTSTSAPDTTAPDTTAPAGGSSSLEGTWVADVGDIIAANTAGVGGALAGAGGFECDGQVTMTFAGGTVERAGEATCGVSGSPVNGTATFETSGAYRTEGDQLVISATTSRGSVRLGPTEVPFPDSWQDGTGTYAVEGDTLTITFTNPAVGTVTQTYTRSG